MQQMEDAQAALQLKLSDVRARTGETTAALGSLVQQRDVHIPDQW